MIRRCFASILCSFSLIKVSDKCNCEVSQDNFWTLDVLGKNDVVQNTCHSEMNTDLINEDTNSILWHSFQNSDASLEYLSESEIENDEQNFTLEDCSITYFSFSKTLYR